MKNIKRYEPSQHRFADVGMAEQENGKWVSYDDYIALNDEIQRSHDQYNGIIDAQLKEIGKLSAWKSGAEGLLDNYVKLMFGKDERHYKVEKELQLIKKELNDLKKNG